MARRPRIDLAGYYHLINRGVARANVYLNDTDKDKYLYMLFRYIEYNPIKAEMTSTLGEYKYSLAHNIINNKPLSCSKQSILINKFTSETMIDF